MYQTIIVPLDGSARSERAIPVAVTLAKASGATLELVRVYTHERHDLDSDPSWEQMFRATVHKELAALADGAGASLGRRVVFTLLEAPVVPSLCDHVAERHAPLVVMTTHGRTGLGRALLGSVSDGLVRRGPAPVLVLRESTTKNAAPTWDRPGQPFRVIVVPLDGTPLAEASVAHAVAIGHVTGARIHLVRVVTPMMATSLFGASMGANPMPPSDGTATQTDLAREYLLAVEKRMNASGGRLDISFEVALSDRPARAIVDSCRNERADLVVMSTHGRGPSRMLVRAVADSIMRDGVEAILLIRPMNVSVPPDLKLTSDDKTATEKDKETEKVPAPLLVV